MSSKQPIVINGHGAKSNKTFDIKDHLLITPENLNIPYVFSVNADYSIEKDYQQLSLKNINNGHWTCYHKNNNVNDVNLAPWQHNELKTFAHNILNNSFYWSNIDNKNGYYLSKDPHATIIIKKGNEYQHLTSKAAENFLTKVENGSHSSNIDGTAIFFYAPNIGKVKILSNTSLSEVLNQIEQIDGPKIALLATCNAATNNKTVSYDINSKKQDVSLIAKNQGISFDDDTALSHGFENLNINAKAMVSSTDFGTFRAVKSEAKNAFEKQHFHYGPLNKSIHTQALELLVKCIIKNPHMFDVKNVYDNVTGEKSVHAITQGLDVNVSELLQRVDFSHLNFNYNDSSLYSKTYGNISDNYYGGKYSALSSAEKHAISCYSLTDYYSMNNLLYGNHCENISLKNALVKSAFCISGLNKILPETNGHSMTFRGDKPDYAQIQERIELIKDSGGITDTKAMWSTSLSKYTAEAFSSNTLIYFDERYGKNISGLSHFGGEQEYLLEPSKILWTKYEQNNGKHIFHAQKVVPLTKDHNVVNPKDVITFNKLEDWANNHQVKTDFITPNLKSILATRHDDSSTISIHDCLTVDNHSGIQGLQSQPAVSHPVSGDIVTPSNLLVINMPHLDLHPLIHCES